MFIKAIRNQQYRHRRKSIDDGTRKAKLQRCQKLIAIQATVTAPVTVVYDVQLTRPSTVNHKGMPGPGKLGTPGPGTSPGVGGPGGLPGPGPGPGEGRGTGPGNGGVPGDGAGDGFGVGVCGGVTGGGSGGSPGGLICTFGIGIEGAAPSGSTGVD